MVCPSPKNPALAATLDADCWLRLWDVKRHTLLRSCAIEAAAACGMSWHPDGGHLAVGFAAPTSNAIGVVCVPTAHVVLATYNQRRFLGRTLRGYLRQTTGDFHLTLADDGSSDGTVPGPRCGRRARAGHRGAP